MSGIKPLIVADENIPMLETLLGEHARIRFLPGREIAATDLHEAKALLVRSVTRVNQQLLCDSRPVFIGTCTIGTDHIDLPLLDQYGIRFAYAPGCNAAAVVDYVLTAMLAINPSIDHWRSKKVGIVGLGEVGGRLQQRLAGLSIESRAYDPFKSEAKNTFSEVLDCDVISLHVPLTMQGEYKTWHLFSDSELEYIRPGTLLINTSRGKVLDNMALMAHLKKKQLYTVLDVYEQEPEPCETLLASVDIATSHIAGYSLQGKIRGTLQVVKELVDCLDLRLNLPDLLSRERKMLLLDEQATAVDVVRQVYDIQHDARDFVDYYLPAHRQGQGAGAFDAWRKHYKNRYEFSFVDINGSCKQLQLLQELGFACR